MRASRVAVLLLILCYAIGESSSLTLARFDAITAFIHLFLPFSSLPAIFSPGDKIPRLRPRNEISRAVFLFFFFFFLFLTTFRGLPVRFTRETRETSPVRKSTAN